MFGDISIEEIKKNAFEEHLFDAEQMKTIEYFAENRGAIIEQIQKNLAEG
jgi:hypothetical protein